MVRDVKREEEEDNEKEEKKAEVSKAAEGTSRSTSSMMRSTGHKPAEADLEGAVIA